MIVRKKIKSIENAMTPETSDQEESLTLSRLQNFKAKYPLDISENDRPRENFLDLMNWAESSFKDELKDKAKINKFVHNRIVIDGQFLTFADLSKIKIECLHKDSFVSWKTDGNSEKFFVQGAFLITTADGTEFIHCALWHKGNQHEDEISFFVLVSEKNYEGYVKIRNSFDEWVAKRDRSNLHIRVIGGEDIPYTKDRSWDQLFLPESIKRDVKNLVENFLKSKDFYHENKMPWKRGLFLFGAPGNGKSSIINTIISNYDFKPVTIAASATDDDVTEAFSYAEDQSPALLYFEDLDSLLQRINVSSFLNLMDGIAAKNGLLVVATANDVSKLKTNITDRPSRFDRKFMIPLPDENMCYIYLQKSFGKRITPQFCKKLSIHASKHGFSYAYLKELYISSMFESLSYNRKIPTMKDIDTALNHLMKDRNILKNNKSLATEKYFK